MLLTIQIGRTAFLQRIPADFKNSLPARAGSSIKRQRNLVLPSDAPASVPASDDGFVLGLGMHTGGMLDADGLDELHELVMSGLPTSAREAGHSTTV